MTFLDLMSITTGVSGLCGALRASRGAGPAGMAFGVVVGLFVGAVAAWIPHRAGSRLIERYALHEASSGWKLAASWLLTTLLIAWIVLAIFAADSATTALLRAR